MRTVTVNSENRNRRRTIDLALLGEAARTALRMTRRGGTEVNMSVLSSQQMRAMNRKYLGEDNATDVIAFIPGKGPEAASGKAPVFLGDIAVCSDVAAKVSRELGTGMMDELCLYVIHGILHLLGYEDSSGPLREEMRKKECEILRKVRKEIL